MGQGIVVKVWNIKAGSGGRSGGAQIGSSIDYITNSEKCDGSVKMEGDCQVGREVMYVTNDVKTLQGLYVGCRNITDVENAVTEMMQVKEYYQKLDGRVALHGIISLDEEESDGRYAGKLLLLADELMGKVFPEHQVVFAVHTNTENLHVHFIVNTVGLGGKKIHMDKSFMRKVMEPELNRLAEKYGFTPNAAWLKANGKDEMPFKDRKIMLRKAVDLAIEDAEDFQGFIEELRSQGLKVNIGKHMSLQAEGMPRAMRTHQLGTEYTVEAIKERIAGKRDPFIKLHMDTYVKSVADREVVNYIPVAVKKYKDMGKEEQKKVVHLLRTGRNPWKERYDTNWQIQKMSEELSKRAKVYDIVRSYAPETMDAGDAKEQIKRCQKEIAAEKKAIRQNLKKYKPIRDLYEEMKQYEVRAYLYEFAEALDYREEYEKYQELNSRLEGNYGKTVEEVAFFLEDQNNQLLYAAAQSEELSEQYRTILRFEKEEKKQLDKEHLSFFEAVGHNLALIQAKDYGIYTSRLVVITDEACPDVKVRVLTTPDMADGKATITTTVTVLDGNDAVISTFSSEEMTAKEFNKAVNELKYQYGFDHIRVTQMKEKSVVAARERRK